MTDEDEPTVEEVLADLAAAVEDLGKTVARQQSQLDSIIEWVETLADEAVMDDEVLESVRAGIEEGTTEVLRDSDSGEAVDYPEPEDRHFQ